MDWKRIGETSRNICEVIGFIIVGILSIALILSVAMIYMCAFGGYCLVSKVYNYAFPVVPPCEMKEIRIYWNAGYWIAKGETESGFLVEASGRTARHALACLGSKVDNLRRDIGAH